MTSRMLSVDDIRLAQDLLPDRKALSSEQQPQETFFEQMDALI